MKRILIIFSLLFILFSLFSCKDDKDISASETTESISENIGEESNDDTTGDNIDHESSEYDESEPVVEMTDTNIDINTDTESFNELSSESVIETIISTEASAETCQTEGTFSESQAESTIESVCTEILTAEITQEQTDSISTENNITEIQTEPLFETSSEEYTSQIEESYPIEFLSIRDAVILAGVQKNNSYTNNRYIVKGKIAYFSKEENAQEYGCLFIEDEKNNLLFVNRLFSKDGSNKFDEMNVVPKIGDTITIIGVIGKNQSIPCMADAWLLDILIAPSKQCDHAYTSKCDELCDKCGEMRTVNTDHTYSNSCDMDCNDCYAQRNVPSHTDGDNNYLCDECEAVMPNNENVLAVFDFGRKRSDKNHSDGSALNNNTVYSSGEHILQIENSANTYKNAFDNKGNSALKIGKSEEDGSGSFEFTVQDNVNKVVVKIAKYKSYQSIVFINGDKYILINNSDDGNYDEIVIDTSVNKKVSIITDGEHRRCMINSIVFYG